MNGQLTDAERYPTLGEAGRRMLKFLREHPQAPLFRNESGNRLTPADLERVRQFDHEVISTPAGWPKDGPPAWLDAFVEKSLAEVPHYRQYGSPPEHFTDLPTISRADLSRDIAAFVPDTVPIDALINFRTSGTTGHPLLLASHPTVAAGYLSYHRQALRRFGIELEHGAGQVSVVLVGFQQKCFTYVSVTPMLGEAGLAKINLHPNDWRDPADRAAYLDALDAELYTGDPISFAELRTLPLRTRPRALISTSMALAPAFKSELEHHFGCPVLDIYSMNEAGPIAVAVPAAQGVGHALLQHRMYVEILTEDGAPVPLGERGEVTLTGGFNSWLPLLRYRTGDFASLVHHDGEWRLMGLAGRPPVTFRAADGTLLNNIEVTHRLQRFPLVQWTLHQAKDGALHLKWCGAGVHEDALRAPMQELFGSQKLTLEQVASFEGKVVQYTAEA